ncbi:MAG: TetR/AcrR family transcriptional regulator [Wenzhouxiangellaceae bacterium]|nr:TetR/AcrR family transcriptional regulator [Wenzhouxiangellaceae bacterium]
MSRRMRPKSFDPDQALERAMLQFWATGYEGASMQSLVDCMGISRQSLYDTFGNKRALFEAALARYREHFLLPRLALLIAPQTRPRDAIAGYLSSAVAQPESLPSGCLMVRAITELEDADALLAGFARDCIGEMFAALVGVIERGQACKDFDPTRPAEALARLVLTTASGAHVLHRLPAHGQEFRPLPEVVLAAIAARAN